MVKQIGTVLHVDGMIFVNRIVNCFLILSQRRSSWTAFNTEALGVAFSADW
jgi:hypothetical protein